MITVTRSAAGFFFSIEARLFNVEVKSVEPIENIRQLREDIHDIMEQLGYGKQEYDIPEWFLDTDLHRKFNLDVLQRDIESIPQRHHPPRNEKYQETEEDRNDPRPYHLRHCDGY